MTGPQLFLFFSTISAKLREGLEQQIEQFLSEHTNTVLIVIDTLQRVRSNSNDANPYASDYRDLGILKELADQNHIAVLLIHHLRKMNDDDPMNMISGTTGISGATDSNFVLRKGKRSGTSLDARQRFMVMDKLMEQLEVNIRMTCDLIRYKLLREAGIVETMDDFLRMLDSRNEE